MSENGRGANLTGEEFARILGEQAHDEAPAVTGDVRELIATPRRFIGDGPGGRNPFASKPLVQDLARYCGRLEVLAMSLAAALEQREQQEGRSQ